MAALTAISPASAAASISTVAVASGPVTISSRWSVPASTNRNRPEWIPTCIFSVTGPALVRGRPIARNVLRISKAARALRAACSSPSKKSRSASPPNFSSPPP